MLQCPQIVVGVMAKTKCVIWTNYCNEDGYGTLHYKNKSLRMHRIVWEGLNGPIPEGLCVCHACDNPPCINPLHLYLGTPFDNTRDKVQKGRQARGSYQGHSKLSEFQVRIIHRLLSFATMTQQDISTCFPVGKSTIGNIACGLNWEWLDAQGVVNELRGRGPTPPKS